MAGSSRRVVVCPWRCVARQHGLVGRIGPCVDRLEDRRGGRPGVDLGELRKQVAITHGDDAPRHVLTGWERASGARALDVGYWDAVAALNTPTLLADATATTRRDAFLRNALKRL